MPKQKIFGLKELLNKALEIADLKKIDAESCHLLAHLITERTSHQISVPALELLFNIKASRFTPSIFTLNILSKFCGCANWSDWCINLRQKQLLITETFNEYQDFNKLFYLSFQPMWIYHRDSLNFLEVNESAIITYGYSREQFLNMSILEIRPQEDRLQLIEAAKQAGDFCIHKSAFRHRLADGDLINVQIFSYAFQVPQGDARLVVPQRI